MTNVDIIISIPLVRQECASWILQQSPEIAADAGEKEGVKGEDELLGIPIHIPILAEIPYPLVSTSCIRSLSGVFYM